MSSQWEDFYWWAENRFADWYINEKNNAWQQMYKIRQLLPEARAKE